MPPKRKSSSPDKIKRVTNHSAITKQQKDTLKTYEVEAVLNKKIYRGKIYYLLKWTGWKEPKWEKAKNCNCEELIKAYEKLIHKKSADEEEDEWEVEKILDKRMVNDKIEYLVKWKDWEGDHEWIKEDDCSCINLIAAYENPKLRKMWNFTGSNERLWLNHAEMMKYMRSIVSESKQPINLLTFKDDFPDDEEPVDFGDGLNIGPLRYKNHWYIVIILSNYINVDKRLLVGDPLNTLFGSPDTRTHPVFKRLTSVYPRIPVKPLLMTPMDRSDVCGFYILAAFERALFVYDPKAQFVAEKLFFDYSRPELIRSKIKPDTSEEFSVALPVSSMFLTGPRCEFCNEPFELGALVDDHMRCKHLR